MYNDLINALFELIGAGLICSNCMYLYRDKELKGINAWTTFYFASWGWWNVFYYPSLDQDWSAVGAALMAMANTTWIGMSVYYIKFYDGNKPLGSYWKKIYESRTMKILKRIHNE